MIANVYGLYEIKIENQPSLSVILMSNAIQMIGLKSQIKFKFDLKGSRINRQVLPKFQKLQRYEFTHLSRKHVLKDEDFRFITKFNSVRLINVTLSDKRLIIQTLKQDTLFFQEHNIMDYSLLLAVEFLGGKKEKKEHFEDWRMTNSWMVSSQDNSQHANFLDISVSHMIGGESQVDSQPIPKFESNVESVDMQQSSCAGSRYVAKSGQVTARNSLRWFDIDASSRNSAKNSNSINSDPSIHKSNHQVGIINSSCGKFVYHICLIDFC